MTKLAPNRVSIPRFVERFPEYREHIIELRFRDAAFNDLCNDYDEVVQALDLETGLAAAGDNGAAADLRRIKAELELELLQRLRPSLADSGDAQ
jgi:uncharacterized protein YdcH (DUF465 family)